MSDGNKLDPNAWMITFSDMLTLMLTFFVLLLAMSSLNDMKLKEAFGALQGAVGPLEKGQGAEVGSNPAMKLKTLPGKADKELIDLYANIKRVLDEDPARGFPKSLEVKGREVTVRADENGAIIVLPEVVLFPPGETSLHQEGEDLLDGVAVILRKFTNMVLVDGYTDDRPPSSAQYPTAWELSMGRALSVLDYLVEKGNILPQRISAEGNGANYPMASNETSAGRARNRRVEIVLRKERTFWR